MQFVWCVSYVLCVCGYLSSFALAKSASNHASCTGSSLLRSSPTMCIKPTSADVYRDVFEGIEPCDPVPYNVPVARWCPSAVVAVDRML